MTFFNVNFLQAYNFQSDFNSIIRWFLFFYFATFFIIILLLLVYSSLTSNQFQGEINVGIIDYKVSVKHFELSTFKS